MNHTVTLPATAAAIMEWAGVVMFPVAPIRAVTSSGSVDLVVSEVPEVPELTAQAVRMPVSRSREKLSGVPV